MQFRVITKQKNGHGEENIQFETENELEARMVAMDMAEHLYNDDVFVKYSNRSDQNGFVNRDGYSPVGVSW